VKAAAWIGGHAAATVYLALTVASAQPNAKVVTGTAATRAFVVQGKPIHPFCIDFPLERASRSDAIELAKCMDARVVPKAATVGWLSAEYPKALDDVFVSFPPYASYRVLARKGDRFLIATEKSGGGSGQFTELFWVRLGATEIAIVKDETSGDRCLGGLGRYQIDGASVRFEQSQSTSDLIALTGATLPAAVNAELRSGYLACDGSARYRYDLNAERMQLVGVHVNPPDPPEAADRRPQACFDRLALSYGKRGVDRLTPDQMKRFGQAFVSSCSQP